MAGKTRIFAAFCGCGYSRKVTAAEMVRPPRCPRCGKMMTVDSAAPKPKTGIRKAPGTKTRTRSRSEAPLPTTVKAGAKFFECVCGERVLFLELTGRPIQCPGCERLHLVEMETPAPAPPKPFPKPAAPAASAGRPLGPGEFLCECGAVQPPRTSRTGRDFSCKACGRKGYVEVDPGLKMRPVFTSGPSAAPKTESPPTPAARAGEPAWTCPCGQKIDAKTVLSKKQASCPKCGRWIELEKYHPQKTMTMIRPKFKDAQPPEPPLPEVDDSPTASLLARLEQGEYMARCECGGKVPVSDALVGLGVQCGTCENVMMVERTEAGFVLRAFTGM